MNLQLACHPAPSPAVIADPAAFRHAMRGHSASVVVITADSGAGPAGFTATSLTSASMKPPMVSFSISRSGSSWPTFGSAGSAVVHFLGPRQRPLAQRFATSGIDRFAPPTRWSRLPTGEPVLEEAPRYFRGVVEGGYEVGDHHMIVLRVADIRTRREEAPLIYHDGSYCSVTPVPDVEQPRPAVAVSERL